MMTATDRAAYSDAAAALLAEVQGESELVSTVVQNMALAPDARRELARFLALTIHAAAEAIRKDIQVAAEREESSPAVGYLVAASRHANKIQGESA